jgi:hypothetical protein
MKPPKLRSRISPARSACTAKLSVVSRQCAALAIAFVFLSNVSLAQQEEVHIVINPRLQAMAAQSPATAPGSQLPQSAPASPDQLAQTTLLLPPGTTLPLGLTRPLSARSSSAKGVAVYLQVTFPVTVGSRMVIPPGAYVQGTIAKITRNHGANPDLAIEMSSASLIFSTGYTVPLTGEIHLVHMNARLTPPGTSQLEGQLVAALPPVAESRPSPAMSATGVTPPVLPPLPSLGNGPRNAMIAIGAIGGAALIGVTVVALRHRNDVYLETGTPLEITLSAPLLLDARSIDTAVQQYSAQMAIGAPPQIVKPPERPRMCYDPGSPGSPDTVIPGSPGTPPTVIPGVNGMPDTVIPGSPAHRTPSFQAHRERRARIIRVPNEIGRPSMARAAKITNDR